MNSNLSCEILVKESLLFNLKLAQIFGKPFFLDFTKVQMLPEGHKKVANLTLFFDTA